ncbi:ComEC/Rec2 family competence protein [Sulfurovum sp. bin170]|uniref:ComEC/Rec2 family competence protein n=1 Tax=Sulfurovum sp. bin170 TaxID=2695268 RepID=UPI0013E01548|nr:ComEC/Rec2 family competence protein [Sulfurovum sp. bin170]NEW61406.1 ComEC/Rec2 family competence protein [Sulfurovum sp. bin170]
MLEKPKLFLTAKEFWLVVAIFLVTLAVRLSFFYDEYQDFISKPFYFTQVEVLQQYEKEKKGKTYTILRVYSSELDLNFFTRTYRKENFIDKRIRLKLFPYQEMRFVEYLGTSFISSRINAVSDKSDSFKSSVLSTIESQHSEPIIVSFYQAIFLATPLQKKLRDQVSTLGISHLIALSGLHLAILSGVLFFLLRPLYRIFQQRYFPYRFDLIDVGFLVLVILGWYVWFVDSPASLLRSYAMMVVGWSVLVLGIELLSFSFLATIVMVLLLLFPKMLVSLAFWFSVSGVFYIFLLLKRFSDVNKFLMTLIISFGIFILMLPIVHMIFPMTSTLQLYSPLLSLGFSFFYPISIFFHTVGMGGVFDGLLLKLFTLESQVVDVKLDMVFGVGYLLLSIGAIYYTRLFYLLLLVAFGFMGWIFLL